MKRLLMLGLVASATMGWGFSDEFDINVRVKRDPNMANQDGYKIGRRPQRVRFFLNSSVNDARWRDTVRTRLTSIHRDRLILENKHGSLSAFGLPGESLDKLQLESPALKGDWYAYSTQDPRFAQCLHSLLNHVEKIGNAMHEFWNAVPIDEVNLALNLVGGSTGHKFTLELHPVVDQPKDPGLAIAIPYDMTTNTCLLPSEQDLSRAVDKARLSFER